MTEDTDAYACLILAAGSSKRMGKAKLVLKYKDESLILRCVSTVLQDFAPRDTYLVTGAYKDRILDALSVYPQINIIHNDNHLEGMGSSIACGVSKIMEKDYRGILLVLPDQILLEEKNIKEILALHKSNPKAIILSNYGNSKGPPSVFPSQSFSYLTDLQGDKGAKHGIVDKFPLELYNFPLGMFDIDKMEDCKEFDIRD